jgi:hypothetical protein
LRQDREKALRYRYKAITLLADRKYADALSITTNALNAVEKCTNRSQILVYDLVSRQVAASFGLERLDYTQFLIRVEKQIRTTLTPDSYSASDRNSVADTDSYLHFYEDELSDRRQAIAQYNAAIARVRSQQSVINYAPKPTRAANVSGEPTCEDESIHEVTDDGKAVKMLSGAFFLVSDVDEVTSSLWLTADEVKACTNDGVHYKLIDGSDDVSATKR